VSDSLTVTNSQIAASPWQTNFIGPSFPNAGGPFGHVKFDNSIVYASADGYIHKFSCLTKSLVGSAFVPAAGFSLGGSTRASNFDGDRFVLFDPVGHIFQLCFIGHVTPGNAYAEAFLEKIKPMEKEGFAAYLGPKTTTELIDCLDSSAALLHFPSEEAFGLVVAEGLARNLKFFGARTGGIIDISQGSAESELFPVDDWPGLTSAMAAWIRRGCPRATQSAELMRARFHPDLIARRHVEIYRKVLGGEG